MFFGFTLGEAKSATCGSPSYNTSLVAKLLYCRVFFPINKSAWYKALKEMWGLQFSGKTLKEN